MVKEITRDGEKLYICEACGMAYREKELAGKCQQWCEQHHSCNLEIIRHAVPLG